MFQLHEITVDDLLLRYRSAGDPSQPSILFLADLTLDAAPAISMSTRLARSYHVVLLHLSAAGHERLGRDGSQADVDAFLPELVARFSAAIGLTRFALYAIGSLVPTAWWVAQRHRARVLALMTQHDGGNGIDVTANSPASKRNVVAVPTLVVIGDKDVPLRIGADGTDLPAKHMISVRRLDTTHFPLDSFHCEIVAEVDAFLRGLTSRINPPRGFPAPAPNSWERDASHQPCRHSARTS